MCAQHILYILYIVILLISKIVIPNENIHNKHLIAENTALFGGLRQSLQIRRKILILEIQFFYFLKYIEITVRARNRGGSEDRFPVPPSLSKNKVIV